MPAGLTFHVLGPIEVRTPGGEPIRIRGPQSRTVVARLLLAEGRVVPAGAIVESVWGPDAPDSAPGTLQTYVSRLRKAFGDDGAGDLRFTGGGYQLVVPRESVDAHRFTDLVGAGRAALDAGDLDGAVGRLREALGLWRGTPFADVELDEARAAVARLEEVHAAAFDDLHDAHLRAGRAAVAVAELVDAVQAEPWRERRRGLLALALYRTGRQAEALAVLDDGRRILADELGLDPIRELRDLRTAILAQDPSLEATSAPAVATAVATREPTPEPDDRHDPNDRDEPSTPDRDDLIGRTTELRLALDALDDALRGAGARCVVIEGEPGIGKTRLAQEILDRAAGRGALTLTGGTLETGAAPAFGAWLDLLSGLPDLDTRALFGGSDALLMGPTEAVLAQSVAENVARAVTAAAAPRGLVGVVEDVQWADPASLELLGNLVPRLGSARVLLVLTVRTLDVGQDDAVVETLALLTRHLRTRRVSLSGLTREQSAQLLRRTVGADLADEVVGVVHRRSEGNPFFATEIARMIAEQGLLDAAGVRDAVVPSGVRDVLRQRVARLPAATGRLLEVAAVLGRQVDLDLLATVADQPLDDVLDALDPALTSRLVELPAAAPGAMRFTHALVRETLVVSTSPLRQARLHLRAADGIAATRGEHDDTLEVIADHLWHAVSVGASDRAARTLEAAAEVALRRQALRSAESLLTRAATLYRAANTEGGLAELRVLRQLGFVGSILYGYGANADSASNLRARELARLTDRLDILLDLIWAEWAGADTGGLPERALHLADEAEALVAGHDDPLLQAGAASMRGFSARHRGDMVTAHAKTVLAVELFEQARVTEQAGFYINGYLTSMGFQYWSGALLEGVDHDGLEQAYQVQRLPFARMVISLFGAGAGLAVGDDATLARWAARMQAADSDGLLTFWSSSTLLYRAVVALQEGDVDAGLDLLRRGQDQMDQAGGHTMLAGIYAGAAMALARHGHTADARWAADRARRELVQYRELAYEPCVDLAEAHVEAALGHRAAAAAAVARGLEVAHRHGSLGLVARIEREAARLALD